MKRSASFIQIERMAAVVAAALVYLFVAPLILASRAEARIYWTNSTAGTLGRAGLDGSDVDQGFISGVLHPYGLAVDGAHVYWTWNAGGFCNFGQCSAFVGRADLDGSGVHQDFVGSGYSNVSGAAVDDAHLYFGRRDTQCEDDYETEEDVCFTTIAIVGLDGPGLPSIDLGEVFPNGVAVDGAHVYWGTGGTIGRANLDGSNVNQGFITTASSWGVAVDPAHVYWTNSGTGTIGRANLDGTGVDQNFITGAANPKGVAVDESHIYWANNGSNTIGRANLDGSGADQSFITGATGPVGVAVDMPPEVPPETQIDSGPSGLTNDSTPTFSFSSTEPGSTFECRLNSGGGGLMEDAFNFASVGSFAPCTSPETLAALPDGGYVFEVRAVDAATNTDPTPASRSFTVDTAPVDTTAPETQIDSGPTGPTNDSAPTFTFSSLEEGATFECRLDGDPFADCDSPLTADPLPDGPHSFEVRARDAAANTDPSPASRSFTIDTAAPDTSIDSGPAGSTNDNTPTFAFSSEQGESFECRLDGGGYAVCSSPLTTSPLSDGPHSFDVRATDAVANTDPSPASRNFAVDTTPPDTTIDSGPAAGSTTGDNTPTFTFSSEQGVSFECRIDGSAFSFCSPPHYEDLDDEEPAVGTPSEGGSFTPPSPLTDGPHTFEVRARDAAANTDPSPASRSFTVDATPPDTSVDSGPSGPTNDTTPSFDFSSGDQNASFACRVDDGAYSACSTPFTTDPLPDGPHTFEVRASDAVGNTDPNPASRSFTVDTTPPETSIDSGPTGPTNDPTPSFTFSSEQGASFECRIDGGVYSACSSPLTTSPLTNGPHSFEVRATDAVANTDPSPASASFRIARGSAAGPRSTGPISADTLPPDMKLSGGGKQTVGEPIEVEVTCPEDCAVVASGKVLVWGTEDRHAAARSTGEKARFGLRKARRQLIAGETATLKLMPKSARAGLELMRLVSSGHKARAAIRVKFTDRAGNSRTASLSIGLQKREGVGA